MNETIAVHSEYELSERHGDGGAAAANHVEAGCLTQTVSSETPMAITYRYADTVERAARDFCARALPGESLPRRVEYEVLNTPACDAFIDEIGCLIELRDGDVDLGFAVVQSAWRYPGQDSKDWEPIVEDIRAIRTVYNQETSERVELSWDDEIGEWKAKGSEGL